jgi:nucleotide-binding universal stress UspA family protein
MAHAEGMTSRIVAGAVIAAVDGSIDSRRGVRWAAEQAYLENRPLVVVHATGRSGAMNRLEDSVSTARRTLREATALVKEAHGDLAVTSLSIAGDPRTVLVEESGTAHLLVLGSRGRGVVKSKLLGSVSADVAKRTKCPLVVTRPTPAGAVKDGIVVGADGTAESLPVIEFAFRQASLRRLPLTVIHCVYDSVTAVLGARGPAYDHPDADELRILVAESVAGLGPKYPDVHVSTRVDRGTVEECLLAWSRPWNLVVVGRHPVHAFRPSASTAVLERSNSVVAVVPEAAPARG